MSDPEPIDLSQLQNLNLAPDWVGDLQRRDTAPGEVVWGRAPESGGRGNAGGGPRGFDSRGPRRDGGGGRGDFQSRGPGGPRGPRQDDRGPRPGGGGGFGGPRPAGGGGGGFGGPPRQGGGGFGGPRPAGGGGQFGGPRPDGPRGPRPEGRGGPRPGGDRREGGGFGGGERRDREGGGGGRGDFRGRGQHHGGHGRFEERHHVEPLPGWSVRLFAEPRSLEAIVRQIKASGRAYPVFELGRLFLAGRDRYVASFSRQTPPPAKRAAKGEPVPEPQPLEGPAEIFQVIADSSLWLTREEAIRHILHGGGIQNYYRRETVSVDPPKGIFTAVAVCGFSGEILGPPNHHSFQSTVARLHRERFSNIPLDRYKSRIRTEKDEALVAKWLENQSSTTVYVPVTPEEAAAAAAKAKADAEAPAPAAGEKPAETEETAAEPATEEAPAAGAPEENTAAAEAAAGEDIPEEFVREPGNEAAAPPAAADAPAPLKTQSEMEAHFLQHHAAGAVRAVSRAKVPGNIPGKLLAPPLLALLRVEVEQQQRFPMQLVQDLCRDLEKQSLKFFKRDRKATFVCRTRPHYIADEAHLSPRLRSIVGVVRANPGITLSRLVSTLAPHVEVTAEAPAPVAPAAEAVAEAPTEVKAQDTPEAVAPPVADAPAEETAGTGTQEVEAVSAEAAAESAVESVAAETAPETGGAEAAAAPAAETESEPEAISAAPAEPVGAEEPGTPVETTTSTESPAEAVAVAETAAVVEASPLAAPAPAAAAAPHLTAEEIAVLQDLRWLVQEGYVTEFASGELQILGRPPQPAPEKKEKEKSPAATPAPAAAESGAESASEAEAPVVDQPDAEATAEAGPEADAPASPEEAAAAGSVEETETASAPEAAAEAGAESPKTEG